MAAPTAPTLESLCTEGLKKAGYKTTSTQWSTLLTRAEDQWMEEIKADIKTYSKRLNDLQTHAYTVTVNGQSIYAMPSDFGLDMVMTLMDGSHYGQAQEGSTNDTIVLAAAEDVSENDIIGKEILLYSGTGSPDARQVIAYDADTKVATVHADWTVDPDGTTHYMIIDRYPPLIQAPLWDYYKEEYATIRDIPTHYCPADDEAYGRFYLFPVPYRASGIPFGIKMSYFADLVTLDLAGDLISSLYRKWRNIWVQGIKAKALEDIDDDRAENELARYFSNIRALVSRDAYGNELTNLQCRVEDYD